jgi:NAD(P)-dependent dehydrogenase (short-subunit alcohol dehydrogenase family)
MPSVAVVGASRGIGREFVDQFLADGWGVHASARSADDLSALEGAGARAYRADVTDEGSLAAMAAAIDDPLDLLIVNAGVGSRERRLADVDAADWTRVMTVNALGPLLAARTVGGKVRDGGTIVALTSLMGSIADNGGGGAWSYRMSKAALNMGFACLAIELRGRDVKTAVLHPGWVKTDMGGDQAPLSPRESVAGLRRVIGGLPTSGGFFDYSGKALPW